MARPFPLVTNHLHSSLPLTVGIFFSIFALVALCARHGTKSRRSRNRYNEDIDLYEHAEGAKKTTTTTYKTPPRSPLANPKKLLSNISNIKVYTNKSNNNNNNNNNNTIHEDEAMVVDQNQGFGEGGLWQKNILMGEKCQPLEFSGVIYYDNYGNVTNIPPKSPRASLAASLQSNMSSYPVSSRSSTDLNYN